MSLPEVTNQRDAVVYAAASAIGIVAGMRPIMAPAILSYLANEASSPDFAIFSNPVVGKTVMVLAGAEAIADKLPFMPRRTGKFALIERIAVGAACGAIICSAMRRSPVVGGIAAAFGALGSTFAAYETRTQISQELGLPDAVTALIEDATTLWAGKAIRQGLALAVREA